MANLLSGISAGMHQGLASLVSNKRADRQARREERRYENQLMMQLGESQRQKEYQDKTFAYNAARDKIRDRQWAEEMGFAQEKFAENKRATAAREEDADLARKMAGEQFNKQMEVRKDEHQATVDYRTRTLDQSKEHFETTQNYNERALAANIAARTGSQLEQERHNREIESLQKRRLDLIENPSVSEHERKMQELEIQKIEAEIDRINAQTKAYGQRPTTKPYDPTSGEMETIVTDMAAELAKEYTDFGNLDPFAANEHPWESPDDSQKTQPQVLKDFGQRVFYDLYQRLGSDPSQISQINFYMGAIFDAMLKDEKFGADMRSDILRKHPGAGLSDHQKLQEARRIFMDVFGSSTGKTTTSAGEMEGVEEQKSSTPIAPIGPGPGLR